MSEQMQKLELEAIAYADSKVPANDRYNDIYHSIVRGKFAELIVRECLDISYRESHLPDTVLFDERSDKFIKDIHNRVARATREHFGVEE